VFEVIFNWERDVILLFGGLLCSFLAGGNFKRWRFFINFTQLSPYFFLPGTGRLLPIVKVVSLC
jgi:hypothetical protein